MSSDQQSGTDSMGTDYRIAHTVLETIVREVVAADPRVQLHQGSRIGRGKILDVVVEGGLCRVGLGLDAYLGDHLPTVAADVPSRVVETMEAITGLTVGAVDVTIVSVLPASESA